MKDLNVDPSYLHQLAGAQRQAAADLGNATASTDGVGAALWTTHGVYTAQGNLAFAKAVQARKAAGEAMGKLSDFLADQLDNAGTIYTGADHQQGDKISRSAPESTVG